MEYSTLVAYMDEARKPGLSGARMRSLAGCEDPRIAVMIAGRVDCPPELLAELAGSAERDVAWAVASNPHTPLNVLKELMKHRLQAVRAAVASSPAATQEMIDELGAEDNYTVSMAAAVHRLGRANVTMMLDMAKDDRFAHMVAKHHSAPVEAWWKLVEHPSLSVRQGLAVNPFMPFNLVAALARADEDSRIFRALRTRIIQMVGQDVLTTEPGRKFPTTATVCTAAVMESTGDAEELVRTTQATLAAQTPEEREVFCALIDTVDAAALDLLTATKDTLTRPVNLNARPSQSQVGRSH